ncbi:hypothetical protein AVEN_65730-1 [Araneus ventricosus]|uniref:Uncharacterized protein n=1 Tax=Araneus ventricosus TaxID=182803 RepID=A0A4Y2X346_ARAVE|nr:hypothetical protein AVEN_65730-1 [Araneus ventricosus]
MISSKISDNKGLNQSFSFYEKEYHVEYRSNNEKSAGKYSGAVSERAEYSLEYISSEAGEFPTSELAELSALKLLSTENKECNDFKRKDISSIIYGLKMNSTQVNEKKSSNQDFLNLENEYHV